MQADSFTAEEKEKTVSLKISKKLSRERRTIKRFVINVNHKKKDRQSCAAKIAKTPSICLKRLT